MNTVNRIVVVAVLVVAAMLCCVLFAGARWMVPALADQLDLLGKSLEGPPLYQVVLPGVILAFVADFVLVLLIILELRRPKAKFIRVEKAAGGEVQVSIASIVNRLEHEVDALPGVLGAKPHVTGRRGGVAIHLHVDIAAGLDVPVQANQIVETVQQVIEEKMGLKMARKPKVSLRTVPHPTMARPSERIKAIKPTPSLPDVPSDSVDTEDA